MGLLARKEKSAAGPALSRRAFMAGAAATAAGLLLPKRALALPFGSSPYDICGGGQKQTQLANPGDESEEACKADMVLLASVLLGQGLNEGFVKGTICSMGGESHWNRWMYEGEYCDPTPDRTLDNNHWMEIIKDLEVNHKTRYRGMTPGTMGLGLVQWTWWQGDNDGEARQLIELADDLGMYWQDLAVQGLKLVQMAKGSYRKLGGHDCWDQNESKSCADWTLWIVKYRERPRNADSEGVRRFQAYGDYAEEIFSLATPIKCETEDEIVAALGGKVAVKESCNNSGMTAGNGSIAEASVSLAYNAADMGATQNTTVSCSSGGSFACTKTYKSIHDQVGMDGYYASCDRSAATAIRWAGADDAFPNGNTDYQHQYMSSHPEKWKKIGDLSSSTYDLLEPGDVLCLYGHIFIFTGNDLIKEKFPTVTSDYDTVHGSIGSSCPQIKKIDWYMNTDSRRPYTIFRNVQPESNSKYKGVTP